LDWNDFPNGFEKLTASLLEALKIKDLTIYEHSLRVAVLSEEIATVIEMTSMEKNLAYLTGLFHDIGKISTPNALLRKKSSLTPDEEAIAQRHSDFSIQILSPLRSFPFFDEVIHGALHHHEYFDGSGYPDGLQGEEIPFLSRLVCVADAYDTLTQGRSYQIPTSDKAALHFLNENSGHAFDPFFVKALISLRTEKNKEKSKKRVA
jgi:putative nucleotidyltransferase with HDIG domain